MDKPLYQCEYANKCAYKYNCAAKKPHAHKSICEDFECEYYNRYFKLIPVTNLKDEIYNILKM